MSKKLIIKFDGTTFSNEKIYQEGFELTESLCSQSELRFGCCESSVLKLKIRNEFGEMNGKMFEILIAPSDDVENAYRVGFFKAETCEKSGDRKYLNITAYDKMYDIINADVTEWYDSLAFPLSMKAFRDSFFAHLGVAQENTTLIQDNVSIEKTIDADEISGLKVISAICELNGAFGHIDRNGEFVYVSLVPNAELTAIYTKYASCEYEEFTTKPISKVQVRQEDGDIGAVSGTGDNTYIVNDNFLVYGKSASELSGIADRLLAKIEGVSYMPFKASVKGDLSVEVGCAVKISTRTQEVVSYLLERTAKGIQALMDSFESKGVYEYSEKVNSANKETRQLKGKVNKLTRTVEETVSEIKDLERNIDTKITQTAEEIFSEASKKFVTEESIEELQRQIDGAIETFTGDTVPSVGNYPTSEWSTNEEKDKHIGDLYIVNEDGGDYAGFYYRFEKNDGVYSWVLLKDNEITKALQDSKEANEKSEEAKKKALEVEKNLADNYLTETEVKSSIKQSAEEISTSVSKTYSTKSEVATAKSEAINSANTNTANQLKNYSTTTQMNSAINQSAESIKSTVANTYTTKDDFNALEIGGRNLLLKSGVKHSNATYAVAQYYLGNEKPVEGEQYTITLKGALGSDRNSFRVYNSGGSVYVGTLTDKGDGLYSWTGNWVVGSATNTYINVYQFYYNNTSASTVEWIKLEKGNKATDWTPAPEDVESDISSAQEEAVREAKSYIEQTADGINLVVSKKVGYNELISSINQSAEGIKISADKIELEGAVTFSSLSNDVKGAIDTATSTANNALLKTEVETIVGSLKKFKNVCGYTSDDGSIRGYLIITTPITPNRMVSMHISGYNYAGTNETIDLTVGFYNYTNYMPNNGFVNKGSFPISDVKVAKVSSSDTRAVVIIGTATTTWLYPKIVVDEVITGFSTASPDSYKDGFSATITTTLPTTYAHITAVPGTDLKTLSVANELAIANWCYNNDKTYINGSKIYAGTITSKQINVEELFGKKITVSGTAKPLPTRADRDYIGRVLLGQETPSQSTIKLYDFNGDGAITITDFTICGSLMLGQQTYEDFPNYTPKEMPAHVSISMGNADEAITVWGESPFIEKEYKTTIGIGNVFSKSITGNFVNADSVTADSVTGDEVSTKSGVSLGELSDNFAKGLSYFTIFATFDVTADYVTHNVVMGRELSKVGWITIIYMYNGFVRETITVPVGMFRTNKVELSRVDSSNNQFWVNIEYVSDTQIRAKGKSAKGQIYICAPMPYGTW